VVVLDCDLQDPPEEIPRLYAKCLEGYDVVFARRISRSDSAFRRWTSRLWHEVLFYLSDTRADPTVGSFSVISQQVVREFLRLNDVHRHYLTLLRWLGFRQAYVDVVQAPRFAGRSSYTLRRLIRHSVIGIASQSTKLLHFSIYSGFVFVFISIAQISYLIIRKLYFGIGVEGWASLMAVLWLVGGTILFSTGVLGVYIGNIFEQTKQRPLYVVRKRVSAERSSRERQPEQPLAVAE
jgi:dolichol-phosphate mannosyltransferase